jgi:hypothetical protein
MNLASYLRLDDDYMLTCFNIWSDNPDEDVILKDLCARLLGRELFKTALIDHGKIKDDLQFATALNDLRAKTQQDGLDPRYYLVSDNAEDLPYKDMVWFVAEDKRPEDIWLAEGGLGKQVLSEPAVSPLINSVRNTRVTTRRLCFPKELRPRVEEYLRPYLSDKLESELLTTPETVFASALSGTTDS